LASTCRIACVRIGRFATGALARLVGASADGGNAPAPPLPTGPSAPEPPAALVAELRGKTRVVATNAEAARRGVEAGMALAQAQALAAGLLAVPWDEERLARAALEVTTTLLAASPRVAWESGHGGTDTRAYRDGVWWIDADGLGEETTLARRLLALARRLDLGPARVGLADAAIAAYAATFPRFAGFPARRMLVVPPGRDAEFLAPYPLGLLDLDEDLDETLHALGLKIVGQFAALEEGEVEARFGPPGLAAHRLARGLDTRGPRALRDDATPEVACDLGSPVATTEPLLFVLKGALASLGGTLRGKGLVAREITLTLTLDDGSAAERAVRPARPTSHEGALFDHCRGVLEDWTLEEPVTAITVRASVVAAASGEQGNLLAPRWADPAALAAAFERIRGREGTEAVAVPETRDGHLPEDAGAWRTGGPTDRRTDGPARRRAGAPAHRRTAAPERASGRSSAEGGLQLVAAKRAAAALRLLAEPPPVRVRLGRAGLEAFHHGDIWRDVTGCAGPERLVPRWWRGRAHHGARDYYTARTSDGTLWLLFRRAKDWRLAGWWD
jgi:protein ImuB